MKNSLAVVIFFLLNQTAIPAEADSIPNIFLGFQLHYGYIIPHSESIKDISNTNPYGFEISRRKFHTTYKDWQVFNAYWISGVEASYFNFQNPNILGYAFAISAFAEPVICYGKRYFFTIKGGGGLSYHSKIYDPDNNPLNLFFSSRTSFPLYVSARFKYRIFDRTYFTLSGSYNHISNGGYKQPNKGMNFPTMAIGLEYFPMVPPALDNDFPARKERLKPGMYFTIQALTTVRVISEDENFPQKACFVYGLHTLISKPFGQIYGINAGVEILCDGYIRESLIRDQVDLDYKRFSVTAGQNFTFGKTNFTQIFGVYLYSPNKARNPVYQKYELAYNIFKNFSLGVYIKAHAHVAESSGFIINYSISL
jgi:hypothetical protein